MADMDSNPMSVFECRVCYQTYNRDDRKPKFLTCHHTFCLSCITQLLDRCRSIVTCPYCRKDTRVNAHEIETVLQTNGDIFDFMDTVQNLANQQKKQPPKPPARSWCHNCTKMAATDCKRNGHCMEKLLAGVAENLKKTLTDRQTSISNWDEVVLRRSVLNTVLTSIQSTVNKLKTNVDALVTKNENVLLETSTKLIELKEDNSIRPSSFDGAIEGQRATQSQQDLIIAEKLAQRVLSLDGVCLTLAVHSNESAQLPWAKGIAGFLRWDSSPAGTIITQAEALKLLGYLTLAFPSDSASGAQ